MTSNLIGVFPVRLAGNLTPTNHHKNVRTCCGYSIVEAAGAISLLLPLLLLVILSLSQIGQYFVLKQEIAYVARQAAKEIAYAYGTQKLTGMNTGGIYSGAANTSDPDYQKILNGISVPGVINSSSYTQFNVYFSIPNAPSLTKSYVTASVIYKGGAGLTSFPWKSLTGSFFNIDMSGVIVNSSCSWPIPHT